MPLIGHLRVLDLDMLNLFKPSIHNKRLIVQGLKFGLKPSDSSGKYFKILNSRMGIKSGGKCWKLDPGFI